MYIIIIITSIIIVVFSIVSMRRRDKAINRLIARGRKAMKTADRNLQELDEMLRHYRQQDEQVRSLARTIFKWIADE